MAWSKQEVAPTSQKGHSRRTGVVDGVNTGKYAITAGVFVPQKRSTEDGVLFKAAVSLHCYIHVLLYMSLRVRVYAELV